MDKTKTLKKRPAYLEKLETMDWNKIPGVSKYNPGEKLADPASTAQAVMECLTNNDPEGVMEMIDIFLRASNKAKLSRRTRLPKSTMYSAMKHRNPTVRTLAKIVSSYSK